MERKDILHFFNDEDNLQELSFDMKYHISELLRLYYEEQACHDLLIMKYIDLLNKHCSRKEKEQ